MRLTQIGHHLPAISLPITVPYHPHLGTSTLLGAEVYLHNPSETINPGHTRKYDHFLDMSIDKITGNDGGTVFLWSQIHVKPMKFE